MLNLVYTEVNLDFWVATNRVFIVATIVENGAKLILIHFLIFSDLE